MVISCVWLTFVRLIVSGMVSRQIGHSVFFIMLVHVPEGQDVHIDSVDTLSMLYILFIANPIHLRLQIKTDCHEIEMGKHSNNTKSTNAGVFSSAMSIVKSFVNDILERVVTKASRLHQFEKRSIITSR